MINADLLHRIPKTILLACKGRYLGAPGSMNSFNYYECFHSPEEIDGRLCYGIRKSYSIDYEPAGNYDSGIIVSKNVEDFTGYNAIVIKGYIKNDKYTSGGNLTVRAYFLADEAPIPQGNTPYDYSSWNLLAETDTEKSFEAYIDISGTGKKKVSFGLYHGEETSSNSVFLRLSEITLIPVR